MKHKDTCIGGDRGPCNCGTADAARIPSNDMPDWLLKALTPLASDMYHQGYADGLEGAIRIIEILKTPELVVESLRDSIPDILAKTTRKA